MQEIYRREHERTRKELKALASETDEQFIARLKFFLAQLNSGIEWKTEEAERVIASDHAKPREILYIPLLHHPDPRISRKVGAEISEILSSLPPVPTLIAVGEYWSRIFDKASLVTEYLSDTQELKRIGILPQDYRAKRNHRFDGWMKAIWDTVGVKPEFEAAGVGSDSLGIMSLALGLDPVLQMEAPPGLSNRVMEAKTRFAINRAADIAGSRAFVFIQGLVHKPGVEGWCQRNSVNFVQREYSQLRQFPFTF